ncbi:MAG: pitrilysin family protein [Burkholderiaceae bacterium]
MKNWCRWQSTRHSSPAGPAFVRGRSPWPPLTGSILLLALYLVASPGFAQNENTTNLTLENGLDLVVIEDRRAPTVIQMLWYRSGSMDESSGSTGVAHVLEHLMFKGTPRFPEGVFSERVAAAGGRENAFTSRDYTGYYQQVPISLLESVMTMEADRMQNLQFSEEAFAKELSVVMEERRSRVEDQPSGKMQEQLMATAFVASPYRTPVIGWMNDLENMTGSDARHWYQTRYAPNNAVLVIAGDVSADQVRQLAEKTYGKIPRKALPASKPQIEPEQDGLRRVQVKAPAEAPSVQLVFKVPGLRKLDDGADQFALSMLAAVLSFGDTGRLTRELVRKTRIANNAWAGYSMLARGPVLFSIGGTPAAGHTAAELEQALIEQIRKIASDGVDDDELTRIKASYVAGQVYEKDSLFSQVMEAGTMRLANFEVTDAARILDGVRRVTVADVQRVAGSYFDTGKLTVATLEPQPIESTPRREQGGQATQPVAPAGGRRH